MYILFIISLLISIAASIYVKAVFSKYSKQERYGGLSGAEAAMQTLYAHGIIGVSIEPTAGSLNCYYSDSTKRIGLSDDVREKRSVAAVAVAMHETGHALQYAEGYAPVRLRNAIVHSTNISSYASYICVMLGFWLSMPNLVTIGIILFLAVIFFQLVTLPVEFNASLRAMKMIRESEILSAEEIKAAGKVLRAAALTYVAALTVSLLQLLRLFLLRGRRR